jgi:hypothetical protein
MSMPALVRKMTLGKEPIDMRKVRNYIQTMTNLFCHGLKIGKVGNHPNIHCNTYLMFSEAPPSNWITNLYTT